MSIKTVKCNIHGENAPVFICMHLGKNKRTGCYWSGLEDSDRSISAWCFQCDRILIKNKNKWTDEINNKMGIKLICSKCFNEIRIKNNGYSILEYYISKIFGK
jgi:hypothetical protein